MTAAQVTDQLLAAPKESGNTGRTEVLAVAIAGDTARVRHAMALQARFSDMWVR